MDKEQREVAENHTDRKPLRDAKQALLSQLLRMPDWEKTTSDVELEAELMNDWEISELFETERDRRGGERDG